jgi:DNA repair exonuclease SbcCD ATPase subunit
MKQNDKYLAEGLDILKREFGQPLPTIEDTIKAHQTKTKKLQESPGDIKFAKKALSKIVKTEQKFRKQMYDLEQVFLQDPNPTNRKLATEIKKSYKDNTTKFMRDSVLMVKRMK